MTASLARRPAKPGPPRQVWKPAARSTRSRMWPSRCGRMSARLACQFVGVGGTIDGQVESEAGGRKGRGRPDHAGERRRRSARYRASPTSARAPSGFRAKAQQHHGVPREPDRAVRLLLQHAGAPAGGHGRQADRGAGAAAVEATGSRCRLAIPATCPHPSANRGPQNSAGRSGDGRGGGPAGGRAPPTTTGPSTARCPGRSSACAWATRSKCT